MKRLLLLFYLLSALFASSQYSIKAIYVRPTGQLGGIVKSTLAGEFMIKPFDDNENFIPRFGIGFIKFATRLDTFPVQGYISSSGMTVTPGTLTYHKFNFVYIYGGLEYKIKLSQSLHLTPGIDINLGAKSISYEANYPLISNEGYSGGSVYIGIRPKFGMDFYVTDRAVIFFEATRNMNLVPHEAFMAHNDYGIGFRFNFKK